LKPKFTKIANDLPVSVPFVGPESQERENKFIFDARMGANESVFGPSKRVVNVIKAQAENVWKYGDPESFDLLQTLSEFYKIPRGSFTVGEGIDGLLGNLVRLFIEPGDKVVSSLGAYPTFKYHVDGFGGNISLIPYNNNYEDLDALLSATKKSKAKILYLSNPDNPMGTYITRKKFDAFYSHVPERVLIILDEAYFEYAESREDYPDSMTYRYDNVITLRSFSKAYGLGGIRIGYGFAHDELISNLLKVKAPFEPSALAQVAGHAALDDSGFLSKTVETNERGMNYLREQLEIIGVKYIPSVANFITTIWDSESRATELTKELLKKGVIVRQLNSFGWPAYIRISIGLEKENYRFINALKETL